MKNELRKNFLDLRKSKPKEELLEKSEKIIKKLKELVELNSAQKVMVYVSLEREVDTRTLIMDLLKEKKVVCVPLCDSDTTMTAREIKSFDDLKKGNFGILEPKECAPIVLPKEIDFVVVPGCVFSRTFHRIGYGKGYYDRFLSGINATKCGLCYDFSLVEDLPSDKTDIPLDIIITDGEVIRRS